MGTVSVPGIATVAPTSADTVLGVQGGVVKRFNASPTFDQLSASSGAGMVGFTQSAVGAAVRTLLDKLAERVSIDDFGAVGDGVHDDTPARDAAIDYAKSIGAVVDHTAGKIYRITVGYTQSALKKNVFLRGPGRVNELSGAQSAIILLDSTDPASFFFDMANNGTLVAEGLIFKCAQYVQDRAFFKFSAALHAHFFKDCSFLNVERPLVYKAGSYFQNASLRDVQFVNSGTIHSESSTLLGTYLQLDNVNHEGSVPVNTEKVLCNLQGVRYINSPALLLEGTLPAAGWTALKLNNTFDAYYTRTPFASIHWFHSEWSGAFQPQYIVDQIGGSVTINQFFGLSAGKYKLSSLGKVTIGDTAFTDDTNDPATLFELENGQCVVEFSDCSMRNLASLNTAGFHHRRTQFANITDGAGQIVLSNDAPQEVWRWDGGYLDGDCATLGVFSGTWKPSTDATVGRKLVFTPAAGALDAHISVKNRGVLAAGDQIMVACRAKLPTFAAGLWQFFIEVGGVAKNAKNFDSTFSGATVDILIPWVLTATPTTFGISSTNGTTSGVATDLELHALAIYHGNSVPRRLVPCYPKNITTWASAAPATGTWAAGDEVKNNAPAGGGAPGWVCTVAGTPGTWKAMANLAA